jgi:branched-chain amino acid transport system permease protein
MADFLQQLITGAAVGCVYALIALGFVLVYKATDVVSLAHGDLMMVGAFLGFTAIMQWHLPFWIGAIFAMTAMGVIGVGIDRLVIRPMVGQPIAALITATLGISMALRGTAILVPGWGTEPHKVTSPFSGVALHFGPIIIGADSLLVIVATLVLMGLLFCFFRFTRLGIAMRATAQNPRAATYVGVSVRNMHSLIWGLSAVVAACACVLLAPMLFVDVNMGYFGLKVLPAAVIGGLGSLPGAVAGGLIIGIVEAMAGFYLPEGAKDVAAYATVLIVLFVMPEGLFGQRELKKV